MLMHFRTLLLSHSLGLFGMFLSPFEATPVPCLKVLIAQGSTVKDLSDTLLLIMAWVNELRGQRETKNTHLHPPTHANIYIYTHTYAGTNTAKRMPLYGVHLSLCIWDCVLCIQLQVCVPTCFYCDRHLKTHILSLSLSHAHTSTHKHFCFGHASQCRTLQCHNCRQEGARVQIMLVLDLSLSFHNKI